MSTRLSFPVEFVFSDIGTYMISSGDFFVAIPLKSGLKVVGLSAPLYLFSFITFSLTIGRWHGQSSLVVETWTDRNGVVHVQLTNRNHHDRFTAEGWYNNLSTQ